MHRGELGNDTSGSTGIDGHWSDDRNGDLLFPTLLSLRLDAARRLDGYRSFQLASLINDAKHA
jgi:hypothetical protein